MTSRPHTPRGLVALLTASGISQLGTRMTYLAVPWYVLATTHSAALTGVVAFAAMAPYVAVRGLGGPIVDRLGAWRTSMVSDAAAAVGTGLIPLLHQVGFLQIGLLAVLIGAAGCLRSAGDTAKGVLLPGVGTHAAAPLERSAGLYDGVDRLAQLVGGPVAGVLVTVTSALDVLALDAATFVVAAALVFLLVPRTAQPAPSHSRHQEASYLRSMAEGLRFLRSDRLLLGMAGMILITNFIDQAGSSVLYPVWARQVAHSAIALGLIGGAFSIGAVVGNSATTWLGSRLPRRLTFGVGYVVAGAPRFLALALATSVSPVLAVMVIGGLGAGGLNPISGAVEYERVPRHLQARVLGALGALAWAGIPFGSLAGGFAVGALGVRTALVGAGAAYGVTTLAPFVFPSWRQMERTKVRPGADASPPRRGK